MVIKRLVLALAALLFALNVDARAQTPSIEVSADSFEAQFSVEGHARQVRVEIFSPSGELVFEADGQGGESIRWPMVTAVGERVADGVYLATITVTDTSGKQRKRIEQLSVSGTPQADTTAARPSPEPLTSPSGSGTTGKIAKWSSATDLGNSIMTESVNKIGVNLATPLATLHVNGTQPAPLAVNGTNATTLLQTGGGKGGNTSGVSGQKGGSGASISLAAGNGGDAPAGSFRGSGGSITLQPGGVGSGAAGTSANGNVLLAPSGIGNVGIGTPTPASRLTVKGTSGNVLEVKDTGLVLISPTAGLVGIGTTNPVAKLHVVGATTLASQNPVLGGENTSTGTGVAGHSKNGDGVRGESDTGGNGVKGKSVSGPGVYGISSSGYGVQGQSTTGEAGHFDGKVTINGALTAGSCTGCGPPSDRGLKTNFSTVNPRFILDRLAQLQIQTWNYKSEPATVHHIGAMAQDFRAAFNFGTDDKTLSVVDAHGVTMAAIQGLYQQNQELSRQLERQGRQIERLQSELNRVRRTIRRRRAPAK
ncbi:MAG TPA: tail fiber domain-containing protein [Pyrinomonadaceae bacterium]|jgi:hypothetical protein